jgi:hypothetical protein
VLPKPNPGDEDVAPPAAPPKPPPAPKSDGFVSPLGLLRLLPNADGVDDAPDVAPEPKRPPAGLLAGVLEAPPKGFDAPAFAPPPNNPAPPGVPEPALAAPKRVVGAAPPGVLLGAPNNDGFGVPLPPCCPKLKAMLSGGAGWMRGVVVSCAAVFT